jgi:quercetin dioxygenase-like cupin family protein
VGTTIKTRAGVTVYPQPGEEHWHRGTPDNTMCHLALFEGTGDANGVTWLEPVTDEQYTSANAL